MRSWLLPAYVVAYVTISVRNNVRQNRGFSLCNRLLPHQRKKVVDREHRHGSLVTRRQTRRARRLCREELATAVTSTPPSPGVRRTSPRAGRPWMGAASALSGGAELSGRPQNRAKAAPHDCPVDATRPCPHPSQATGYYLAAPSRMTITGAAKWNSCKSHDMLITCSGTPNDATGSSHSVYAPPTYLIGF